MYTGPLRFIFIFPVHDTIGNYLKATAEDKEIKIYSGSLLQKFYYPEGFYPFIIDNPEYSFTNETN